MPKLNGLAERMKRTIMERVRSMLAHAKLSKTFWAEALMTVLYVINRLSSVPLDGDIPQRVWTGKDISYQYLKVFSCLAYMHGAKDRQENLNPKTRPCILLGYGDNEFGCRLWNLAEKKVVQSTDAVFMEENTIVDWESEKKTSTSESTDRDSLDGSRIHPVGSQIPVENHDGPAGFEQETGLTKGEPSVETGQDPEWDSEEGPTKEPSVQNHGRRHPLRDIRALEDFRMKGMYC